MLQFKKKMIFFSIKGFTCYNDFLKDVFFNNKLIFLLFHKNLTEIILNNNKSYIFKRITH